MAPTGLDTNDGSFLHPWRTLSRAASTVSAGTLVYARAGTYAPFSILNSGAQGSPITFRNYPGETAVVAGDGSRSTVILVSGAHDVALEGLVVQGAPNQWGAGIRIENSAYRIAVRNTVLRDNRSFGIKLANVSQVIIAGNEITGNETGIEISGGGSGVVVEGNVIHDNDRMVVNTVGGNDDRGANAIVFYRTTGTIRVRDNRIYGNRATSYDYGYDGGAFEIYAASNVIIEDNVAWNNENVVETGTDGTTPCDGNRFVGNISYGGEKTGPTMGLILRCASDMLVANNTFYGLDRFVFDVTAQASAFGGSIDGLRILNNVAIGAGAKIYSIDSAMPASVVIDHGMAFETTGGSIAYVYGKGNTSSLATFTSWTGFEQAGRQADPGFAGPARAMFDLTPGSPAIDRAVLLAGWNDPYAGAAPDLGALEYVP